MSPEDIEDERVMRAMTNLVVTARLEIGVRAVWGCDIEAAYRKRHRRPSHHVRAALRRLEDRGVVERDGSLDLWKFAQSPDARTVERRTVAV